MSTLESIRENSKGWLSGVLVAIIIVPFALWGINSYFTGDQQVNVATVDGEAITQTQFRQALAREKRSFQAMLGSNFRPELLDSPEAKKSLLNKLINQQILTNQLIQQKYRVSDSSLSQAIRSADAFKRSGRFDPALYQQQLRSQNLSAPQFESQLRRDLLNNQINSGLAGSGFTYQSEFDSYVAIFNQQRDIRYSILDSSRYSDDISISNEAIQAYYDQNLNRFQTTREISVSYIELNLKDIADGVTVSESDINEAYGESSALYVQPERRRARHILLEIADQNKQATYAQAKDIIAKVKNGESFPELAKIFSKDLATAKNGGDLGFIVRGTLDPVFERSLFLLENNEISSPVETSFGLHIIQATDIQPEKVQSLDEVRQALTHQIQSARAEKIFIEKAELMQNLVFENPLSLETASTELSLPIKETSLFSKSGGTGILSEDSFLSNAFSEQVLVENFNSDTFEIPGGRYIALRLKEDKKPTEIPLEIVADEIRLTLKSRDTSKLVIENGQRLISELATSDDQSTTVERLSKSLDLEWKTATALTRRDPVATTNTEIINKAFSMSAPQPPNRSFDGVHLENGDYAIIELTTVRKGLDSLEKSENEALKQQLARIRAESELFHYIQTLRDSTNISTSLDLL